MALLEEINEGAGLTDIEVFCRFDTELVVGFLVEIQSPTPAD